MSEKTAAELSEKTAVRLVRGEMCCVCESDGSVSLTLFFEEPVEAAQLRAIAHELGKLVNKTADEAVGWVVASFWPVPPPGPPGQIIEVKNFHLAELAVFQDEDFDDEPTRD